MSKNITKGSDELSFDKLDELQTYAELDGSELGDGCMELIEISTVKHYLNDEFSKAVDKEINKQLKWFRKNTIIKTKIVISENEEQWLEFKDE